MISRFIISALALLATLSGVSPAHAIGAGASYLYPAQSSGPCSPLCFGVRGTFIVPDPVYVGTNGEGLDSSVIYVSVTGAVSHVGANCLMQFGIGVQISSSHVKTFPTFWQAFSCSGSAVVNPVSMTFSVGDTVTLELTCISNCNTGDTTAVWNSKWTNVSTGATANYQRTGFTVYPEFAQFVIELQGTAPDSASVQSATFVNPVHFFNFQVNQGGVWGPAGIPGDSPPSKRTSEQQLVKTSNSTYAIYTTSIPIDDALGPSWVVCGQYKVGGSIGDPCPYAPTQGNNGTGP